MGVDGAGPPWYHSRALRNYRCALEAHVCRKGVSFLTVTLRDEESFDGLLRRFNREVMNTGVMTDVRRKRFFVSKGEQKRIDARKGRRRARIRQLRSQSREM